MGVVGAMQAAEALKLIVGIEPTLAGRLLMLDGRAMDWSTMRVQRASECAVCRSVVG
ncbi:Sulfur carrier protein ThiS adenylyltransferase [compost metagenome]